jgi:hypothetical protein
VLEVSNENGPQSLSPTAAANKYTTIVYRRAAILNHWLRSARTTGEHRADFSFCRWSCTFGYSRRFWPERCQPAPDTPHKIIVTADADRISGAEKGLR